MATSLTPYPSHTHHRALKTPPNTALQALSAFLSASESTPYLHPDAQLTPAEIKFSTTGGPSGGLVLHNLRRVHKGLDGEVLAPEKDELNDIFGLPDGGDDARVDAAVGASRKGALKRKSVYDGVDVVDPVEYARSQVVLEGEVGDRDQADGEAEEYYDADAMEVDDGDGAGMTEREKKARKEEKKKRQKAEKKDREVKRANKS